MYASDQRDPFLCMASSKKKEEGSKGTGREGWKVKKGHIYYYFVGREGTKEKLDFFFLGMIMFYL